MQCRATWRSKKFGARRDFSEWFDLGGKLSNLFSPSKVFPAKLYMYLDGPEFLHHLVVAVQSSSPAKKNFGRKSSHETFEYMTRIFIHHFLRLERFQNYQNRDPAYLAQVNTQI